MLEMASSSSSRDDEAIAMIEAVVEGIAERLERQQPIFIPLRYKPRGFARLQHVNDDPAPIKFTNISWPGQTAKEARRFSILLLLDIIRF